MTYLVLAYGIAATAVLAWLGLRLSRTPQNLPLRALTGLAACLAIAFPFGLAADREATVVGLPPMMSRLIQHGALLIGVTCLVFFFLFSALEQHKAWPRARRFAVPLVAAEAILVVTAALAPPSVHSSSSPAGAVFTITADLYLAFGFATAFLWARRYAREANPRLARGLKIASVGLAAIVVANCVFIPEIILRWAGASSPSALAETSGAAATVLGAIAAAVFLLPGVVIFLAGIIYPAAAMRVTALRVWAGHRRVYRQLGPLWTILHKHFPDDELRRVTPNPWRDVFRLRGIHRRYYRRVVECRDGLVRISPYLPSRVREDNHRYEDLARSLKHALAARAAGQPARSSHAMPVVVATADGLDADVRELVSLSLAMTSTGDK